MWPRSHSRGGTGTAFPSPHSLPGAGNIFLAEAGGTVIWRDGGTELSLLGKHCHLLASSTLSALLLPYFSSAASWPSCRACLLQAARGLLQVSPGLYGLPQPAPVTSQPSPPPSARPHLRPLTPHPSRSAPGLPLPQAFCAPAFPSAWAAGRSCPGELDSFFLISFRSLLRCQGITLGEACSSHPFFFFF